MKITVKNTTLEANMLNLKTAKAYEHAAEVFIKLKDDVANAKSLSDIIKQACDTVFAQIDAIFGDGTSTQLFGGEYSLDDAILTWLEIDKQMRIAAEAESSKISKLVQGE